MMVEENACLPLFSENQKAQVSFPRNPILLAQSIKKDRRSKEKMQTRNQKVPEISLWLNSILINAKTKLMFIVRIQSQTLTNAFQNLDVRSSITTYNQYSRLTMVYLQLKPLAKLKQSSLSIQGLHLLKKLNHF